MVEEKALLRSVGYQLIEKQRANNVRWQSSCQSREDIQRESLDSSGN